MTPGRIFVGIGGWSYAPWRGVFYPEGLAQARELEHASGRLTAIEINGTFYSTFKPAVWAKWRDATPEGFVFTIKGSRFCTNRKQLSSAGEAVARFAGQGLAELGDRLGPINWQLPETKRFDPDDLDGFLSLLPREVGGLRLRHAIEARHESFDTPDFVALARKHGVAVTFADSPKFPAIEADTADFTYARLMRTREEVATGYDAVALDGWTMRAGEWAKRGDAFVFFISGAKIRAPAAAEALIARLNAVTPRAAAPPAAR